MKTSRAKTAPGPRPVPILGNIQLMRSPDPLAQMVRWRREFGDVIRWTLGPRLVHMVNDVEAIKHVLQMNNRNYTKGEGYLRLKVLLGEGLLTSEGEFWRRQRRLAQPAFHRQQIEGFASIMTHSTEAMLSRWESKPEAEPFDINGEMMRATLDIVARALFSTALSEQEFDEVARSLTYLLSKTIVRILRPWSLELPTPGNRQYHASIARLDQIILRIISERRASKDGLPDLLGMLLDAEDEETGEKMSDQQLRDEIMTLFLAGHETTANALSWFWVVLSRQPAIREQVEEELERVLGGRVPTAQDAQKLPFTRSVLDEVMRLYPPIPAVARRAIEDDEICGFRIPAGSNVLVSPYVLHRHPELWENPEGFDPSRFCEEASKARHKFAYLPFGGGPRFCIGNNFALMEALLILAMVMQRYRVELLPGHPIAHELSVTLRPKHGVQVLLRRR